MTAEGGKRVGPGQGRRAITQQEKDIALEVYAKDGLNAAVRASGISKKTVQKLAAEHGVDNPKPQEMRDRNTIASLRAAQLRTKHVNEKIDRGIDRTINLLELAQAREIQLLARIEPDKMTSPEDLRNALGVVTRSRTTAIKDFEMLLRRAGLMVGSADGSEFVDVVRSCLRLALQDVALPPEFQEEFQRAFAKRLRDAQGAEEAPAALEAGDPAVEDEDDEDDDEDGDLE